MNLDTSDIVISGAEPRMQDLRLAEALGFDRPRKIRELIARWRAALERFGPISPHRGAKPRKGSVGGRPEEGWLLNKKQALFLCTKSETEAATEVTIALVDVFDAWTAGQLPAPGPFKDRARRSLATRRSWAEDQARWWARRADALAAEERSSAEAGLLDVREGQGWVCVDGAMVLVDFTDWQVIEGEALVINGNARVRVVPLAKDERGFPAWALHGGVQRAGYIEEPHWTTTLMDGPRVERFETVTVLGRVLRQKPLQATIVEA